MNPDDEDLNIDPIKLSYQLADNCLIHTQRYAHTAFVILIVKNVLPPIQIFIYLPVFHVL